MVKEKWTDEVMLDGLSATYIDGVLSVKGEKGEVTKKLHQPTIDVKVESDKIVFTAHESTKREKTLIGTFKAHTKNLIKGAKEGYTYKLKICAGHFPMNVSVSQNSFIIKNFLGEKVPRTVTLRNDVTVKIEGDIVIVESTNKEVAGQTAADIEQLTIVRNRDRRIFQDGIFITAKGDKQIG